MTQFSILQIRHQEPFSVYNLRSMKNASEIRGHICIAFSPWFRPPSHDVRYYIKNELISYYRYKICKMIRQRCCWLAHQISQQTEHSKKSISRLRNFAIFGDNMSHQGLKLFPGSHAFRAQSTLPLSKEIRTRLSTSGTVLYGVQTWGWHLWQLSCNTFYINWYSDQNEKTNKQKKKKKIYKQW